MVYAWAAGAQTLGRVEPPYDRPSYQTTIAWGNPQISTHAGRTKKLVPAIANENQSISRRATLTFSVRAYLASLRVRGTYRSVCVGIGSENPVTASDISGVIGIDWVGWQPPSCCSSESTPAHPDLFRTPCKMSLAEDWAKNRRFPNCRLRSEMRRPRAVGFVEIQR